MYIDKESLRAAASENVDTAQVSETPQSSSERISSDDSPGYAPISPETPSWGAPSGTDSPGYAPISPETPSWGAPSGTDSPGYAPISPETPSWGTPSGSGSPGFAPISPETPSWRPPSGTISGGTISGGIITTPPIVVIPGQSNNNNNGSCCSNNSRTANVRFLHAAANQPAFNIRLGNRTVVNNMQYGNSTPYYMDNGSQRTMITVMNAQTGRTMYQTYLNLADGTAYTVSIVNDGSGISLFVLTDTPCSNRNSSCLRAVNLSSNSGPVDIFLSGYGRIFQRVNQLASTQYRTISQGAYRALVSEALPCTNNNAITMANEYVECNNTRIAIMDSATFNVTNTVSYTLYIIGLAYQFPSLQILTLESDLVY